MRTYSGPPERYGLPKPDHRFGEAHPTVSGRILDRIQHGTITPKPNIERFEGPQVRFVDGSAVEADVVVYCTGYKISFPFFDEDFISAPENRIELFRRVFHPDIPNVFFIGLLQPLGAIMPLAEAQGAWVGDYLLGRLRAARRASELVADIAADQAAMRARYVASKRHTIQVDFDDYLYALAKERRAGAARARARGYASAGAVPTFCRHNRFIERCPICAREQAPARRRGTGAPRALGETAPQRPRGRERGRGAGASGESAAGAPRAARRAGRLQLRAAARASPRRQTRRGWSGEIAFADGQAEAARRELPRGSTASCASWPRRTSSGPPGGAS